MNQPSLQHSASSISQSKCWKEEEKETQTSALWSRQDFLCNVNLCSLSLDSHLHIFDLTSYPCCILIEFFLCVCDAENEKIFPYNAARGITNHSFNLSGFGPNAIQLDFININVICLYKKVFSSRFENSIDMQLYNLIIS